MNNNIGMSVYKEESLCKTGKKLVRKSALTLLLSLLLVGYGQKIYPEMPDDAIAFEMCDRENCIRGGASINESMVM